MRHRQKIIREFSFSSVTRASRASRAAIYAGPRIKDLDYLGALMTESALRALLWAAYLAGYDDGLSCDPPLWEGEPMVYDETPETLYRRLVTETGPERAQRLADEVGVG